MHREHKLLLYLSLNIGLLIVETAIKFLISDSCKPVSQSFFKTRQDLEMWNKCDLKFNYALQGPHLCEIGADESLLHADPYRDGYQQLLVRLLQLVSRSGEQLNAAQFLAIRTSLLLAVPEDR